MRSELYDKLLKKQMTRREFLQLGGSSILILIGLGNLVALISHLKKTAKPLPATSTRPDHGFGTRKFGV